MVPLKAFDIGPSISPWLYIYIYLLDKKWDGKRYSVALSPR